MRGLTRTRYSITVYFHGSFEPYKMSIQESPRDWKWLIDRLKLFRLNMVRNVLISWDDDVHCRIGTLKQMISFSHYMSTRCTAISSQEHVERILNQKLEHHAISQLPTPTCFN